MKYILAFMLFFTHTFSVYSLLIDDVVSTSFSQKSKIRVFQGYNAYLFFLCDIFDLTNSARKAWENFKYNNRSLFLGSVFCQNFNTALDKNAENPLFIASTKFLKEMVDVKEGFTAVYINSVTKKCYIVFLGKIKIVLSRNKKPVTLVDTLNNPSQEMCFKEVDLKESDGFLVMGTKYFWEKLAVRPRKRLSEPKNTLSVDDFVLHFIERKKDQGTSMRNIVIHLCQYAQKAQVNVAAAIAFFSSNNNKGNHNK